VSARLGVDVGGTFTDVALWDETSRRLAVLKLPSVPHDPAEGILAGIRGITEQAGVRADSLAFVAHGTTVATNALLEGKGARTALLTTRGFRDLLEIARQKRPALYDLQADKPSPLVPRDLRFEVRERLLADGSVLEKLRVGDVEAALAALGSCDPEAIAVCFLYSFLDPTHERQVAARIRDRLPLCHVSLSSEVSPEFREYERLSTTVLNAYLGPLISRYLGRFDRAVRELGIPRAPYINQSNGGIISVAAAARHPVRTLLSGPSAGVMGAAWAARDSGFASLITFDMGGTSTDVARVEHGQPIIAGERSVAGYSVRIPTLEIETVGAGGGSLRHLLARLSDQRQHGSCPHRLALGYQELQDGPAGRRGHFGVYFVGVDLDQRLELLDPLMLPLQPFSDRALDDRLAELGHDDFDRHEFGPLSFLRSIRGQIADGRRDLIRVRHEPVLQRVTVRNRRNIRPGQPPHRRVEQGESLLC